MDNCFYFWCCDGSLAISVGVGGAILVTPFLNAYMGYPLKRAINASLFYVLFSSSAAFVSWTLEGHLHFKEGIIVGIASILGVYLGIVLGTKASPNKHKYLLVALNIAILVFISSRIFLS